MNDKVLLAIIILAAMCALVPVVQFGREVWRGMRGPHYPIHLAIGNDDGSVSTVVLDPTNLDSISQFLDAVKEATMRRVNVAFSDDAYATLEAIAVQRGMSVPDLVREAINWQKWLADTEREGGRLLVEKDGEFRELVPTNAGLGPSQSNQQGTQPGL